METTSVGGLSSAVENDVSLLARLGTQAKRADQVLRHIIIPAALNAGYAKDEIVRADHLANPGIITSHIVEHLLNAELVIADLTDHNPNVFYELAIRDAVRKPIVQLIQAGQKIPFDVSPMRTLKINIADPDELDEAEPEDAD